MDDFWQKVYKLVCNVSIYSFDEIIQSVMKEIERTWNEEKTLR